MDIKDFRQKYPQYDDISDIDLANTLHSKHYSDMSFESFATEFGVSSKDIQRTNTNERTKNINQFGSIGPRTPTVRERIGGFLSRIKPPALGETTPGQMIDKITLTPKKIAKASTQSIENVETRQNLADAFINGQEIEPYIKAVDEAASKEPITGTGFISDTFYKSIATVSPMMKGYWEASPYAAIGAGIGAAAAVVLGQLGPQAGAPEELATVPAAAKGGAVAASALLGIKTGVAAKQMEYWYREGMGSMIHEQVKNGVPIDVAGPIAAVAAIPYAAIEFSQISKLTPGLRKQAQMIGTKTMMNVFSRAAKKYGQTWTHEVFEEILQEGVLIAAKDMGNLFADNDLDFDNKGFLERANRLIETAKESGQAMLMLPLAGATLDIRSGAMEITSEDKFKSNLMKKYKVDEKKASETLDAVKRALNTEEVKQEDAVIADSDITPIRDSKGRFVKKVEEQPKTLEDRNPYILTEEDKPLEKKEWTALKEHGWTIDQITRMSPDEARSALNREPDIIAQSIADKVLSMKEASGVQDTDFIESARALYPDRTDAEINIVANKMLNMRNDLYNKHATKMVGLAKVATDEITNSVGFARPSERKGGPRAFLHEKHSKVESLLYEMTDLIDQTISKTIMYDDIDSGVDLQDRFIMTLVDNVHETVNSIGFEQSELEDMSSTLSPKYRLTTKGPIPWIKTVQKVPFKISSGETVKFTRAEMLSIYMHSLNEHNLKALTGKRGFYTGKKKHGQMSEADVENIVSQLTDKEKSLGDMATQWMQVMGESANSVSLELDGVRKFIVENYWPATRTEATPKPLGKRTAEGYKVLEDRSFTQQRIKQADSPLVVSDFFMNLHNSIVDHAAYLGLAKPLRNANMMLSDRQWSQSVRNKYGQTVIDVMSDYVARVQDPAYQRIPTGGFLQKRMNKAVRAMLGFNPSTALKQFVSYWNVLDEFDTNIVLKGAFHRVGKREMAIVEKHIPQIAMRYRHGRVIREIGDMGRVGAARKSFLRKNTFDDAAMTPVTAMDKQAVLRIVYNTELELAQKQPDLQKDTKEWGNAMNKRVLEVVRRTQPTWHPKDRSHIGGTRNQVLRWFTVFHSQRETNMGMLTRANQKYKVDGDVKSLLKTYSVVATTNAMYGVITTLVGKHLYRRKTDIGDFVSNLVSSVASLPYFGEILVHVIRQAVSGFEDETVKGTPVEILATEAFEESGKAFNSITKALRHAATNERFESGKHKGKLKWKVDGDRAAESIIKALALYTGAPILSIFRMVTGATQEEEQPKIQRLETLGKGTQGLKKLEGF